MKTRAHQKSEPTQAQDREVTGKKAESKVLSNPKSIKVEKTAAAGSALTQRLTKTKVGTYRLHSRTGRQLPGVGGVEGQYATTPFSTRVDRVLREDAAALADLADE